MAIEYLTNDVELASIADAIRSKGGTSAALQYPEEFVSAIDNIDVGIDISDTTAAASDVLTGKYFYTSQGAKTQGTIAQKSSSDVTVSGPDVTVPVGYYSAAVTKTVGSGSAKVNATTITATPTITVNGSGNISVTVSGSKSIAPDVTEGYITTGTAGTVSVNGSGSKQLNVKAATAYPVSSTDQTISSGVYLTGEQLIRAVTTSGISAGNIKSGTTVTVGDDASSTRIKNVSGTFTSASTVSSGQTAAGAAHIRSGYSAWVNGAEVKGSISDSAVSQGTTTVSGTTVARGIAHWEAGYISTGTMAAAAFSNSVASGKTASSYVDISNTSAAPVLVSGGYLYINKGYTDDLKISLAKLVPDGASANLASGVILSGYSAYNNDGTLIAGNIPTKSSSDVTVSAKNVTVPVGYYATAVTKSVADGSAATPATTITSTPTITIGDDGLITATNSKTQSVTPTVTAGYVSTGTAGTITVNGSGTSQLETQAETTHHIQSADAIIDTPADVQTFDDAVENGPVAIDVNIAAVQDLNGYDRPWAPGHGKNLADPSDVVHQSIKITSGGLDGDTTEKYRTVIIDDLPAGTYTFSTDLENCYMIRMQIGGTTSEVGEGTITSIGEVKQSHTFTTSETGLVMIAVQNSGSTAILTEPNYQIERGSTATEYAPYANICPITGWTGAKISRIGKNLFDYDAVTLNKGFNTSTGGTSTNTDLLISDFISVKPGTSYVISATNLHLRAEDSTASNPIAPIRFCSYNAAKDKVGSVSSADQSENNYSVYETNESAAYIRVQCGIRATDIQLELGESPTAYVPYGDVYNIAFPEEAGEIYGGTLTINKDGSGLLKQTYSGMVLDGTESWSVSGSGSSKLARLTGRRKVGTTGLTKCSHFVFTSVISSTTASGVYVYTSGSRTDSYLQFRPKNPSEMTAATWKAYLAEQYAAGTPVTVIWNIEVPYEYELNAEQVTSLLGTNNIWADTGDINSVTYQSSTDGVILNDGIYTTGQQKITRLTTSGIYPSNIKVNATVTVGDSSDPSRFENVTGTFTDPTTVSEGQTAADASVIMPGYSAWVNGAEVKGALAGGTYGASVSSHSVSTTPVVTGSLSGTITSIGTTTKPSGTDGTNYWTITPSGSVTTTGVSSAKGKATVSAAGYIAAGESESAADTVNITPTVTNGAARYIIKGTITNNTSGGTSAGTINYGSQIKIGAGYYPSDQYYTAKANSGTITVSTSYSSSTNISCSGYENVYITGITVKKDASFSLLTAADTALDTSSPIVVTNRAYRRVYVANDLNGFTQVDTYGDTYVNSGSATAGTINVNAYNSSETLEGSKTIVNNGKWVTTEVTQKGTYYGKVIVPNDCLVITVSATSNTITTINNSDITADYYVFNTASDKPGADITWSTSAGSLTLTCSAGIPAMTVFLCRQL